MMGTVAEVDLIALMENVVSGDAEALLNRIESIAMGNPDFDVLLSELASLLQKVAVIQILPKDSVNPLFSDPAMGKFAATVSQEDVQLFYQIAIMGHKDLSFAPDMKAGFEMTLIRMLAFKPAPAGEGHTAVRSTGTPSSNTPVKVSAKESASAAPAPLPGIEADSISVDNWKNIIDEMSLTGLIKELAGNCTLKVTYRG